LGGGGIDAAVAPVLNANDNASTFAADGALGVVAASNTGASQLLPTKDHCQHWRRRSRLEFRPLKSMLVAAC
jgi:hypothetical protein